jgi:outer membrane protein
MKHITRTFAAVSALLLGAVSLTAQPAIKLVVVDMARVFDNHYKKEEADTKFREAEQSAQAQIEELNRQGQALVEEYKEMLEQSKSALLTAEARAKAESDAESKLEEIQRKQADVQNFRVNARNSLQQRMKTHRDLLLEEISKVVIDMARKKGATLVIDKSGPSLFGIPNILYADAAYEITDEVLAEVNKDRPPPAPAAGGAAAKGAQPAADAAKGSAPATGDSSLFSAPKQP